MERVLVGVDGSDASERAVDFAAQWAALKHVDLWLVSVSDHGSLSPVQIDALARGEHMDRQELLSALSVQLLERAKERAEELGAKTVHMELRTGDPAREIIEVAQEINGTMIIVGKRGCGTLAGLIVGSVSHKLVSLASVPVVVVP